VSENTIPADDRTDFKGGSKVTGAGAVLAVAGIGIALGIGYKGTAAFRPFLFGYLAAYLFVLSIALGCLGFVLLQHLTRAAWSVGVRRTAENFAAVLPLLAILGIPFIVTVDLGKGTLYRWALPMERAADGAVAAADQGESELPHVQGQAEGDETAPDVAAPSVPSKFTLDPLDLRKRNYGLHWLHPAFFTIRVIFYLVSWAAMAIWFRKKSILQDTNGDDGLTRTMQAAAGPCVVILGLTMTGAAFDLIMSLDPHWYSTMFGVYYIANSFLSSYAILIIAVFMLQKFGYLRRSITIEHYHDLGKYLFAFTFFYGYIAFSQYMLMWYANIPEETEYMARHGVSTAYPNGWSNVILAILFLHILVPFAALLSRHVKRRPALLVFLALWQLVMVAVDMYWLVLPEMGPTGPEMQTVLVTIFAAVGLLGAMIAAYGAMASKASLRPTHDPRLADSLVFQNI